MKKHLTFLVLSLLPVLGVAAPELSGSPGELSHYLLDQKKIINVHGEAELKIETDTAIVAITVKTKANRLERALEQNETIRNDLRQTLLQTGIGKENIKASKFSSTPNYSWYKDKPSSYEVNNEVKISIHNETQLQAIAKLVDEHKEVFLGATEHLDSNEQQNKLKVLETALENIQDKRELYEKKLGMQLKPVRISNQNIYREIHQPRARVLKQQLNAISAAPESMDAGSTSRSFDSVVYKAHTTVEFLVE